jgi:hypothetical protein
MGSTPTTPSANLANGRYINTARLDMIEPQSTSYKFN